MEGNCDKSDNLPDGLRPASPSAIWPLAKDRRLKRLLLVLEERMDCGHLVIDARAPNHPAVVHLFDARELKLSALAHTLGQEGGRYGLQFNYPAAQDEDREDLELAQAVELLAIHFTPAIPSRENPAPWLR